MKPASNSPWPIFKSLFCSKTTERIYLKYGMELPYQGGNYSFPHCIDMNINGDFILTLKFVVELLLRN